MAARRIAALAAGGDRPGADAAARIRPRRRSCCRWCRTSGACPDRSATRRRRASPSAPSEGDRDARPLVVEALVAIGVVDPLEAVDLAPGHPPAAPVVLEPGDGAVERIELVAPGSARRSPPTYCRGAGRCRPASVHSSSRPETGQGGRLGSADQRGPSRAAGATALRAGARSGSPRGKRRPGLSEARDDQREEAASSYHRRSAAAPRESDRARAARARSWHGRRADWRRPVHVARESRPARGLSAPAARQGASLAL